ncbi:MAG: ParB/RepB/Spo0J family partition protein [Desulfobulbaceae bacterium]
MKSTAADHRSLAASAIDLADRTYFLSPEDVQPPPRLVNSIREYGILHPPLVQQQSAGRYIVVAGWKRLIAAVTILHWDSVPCIVVPPDCPALHLHSCLLEESLAGSPLSLAEQSAFFASLRETCPIEDILPLLAKLGHRPNKHQLDELLGLRELAPSARLALHRGILNYTTGRKLLRLSPADQETLVALITRFQLGGSKQQKLIDQGTELLRRKQGDLSAITTPFLEHLDMSHQVNIPQQGAALLNWLHEQCFPRYALAVSEFNRRVAQLNLPSTMQIEHSPSFEEDSVTLALKFTDWDSLQKSLPAIHRILAASDSVKTSRTQ